MSSIRVLFLTLLLPLQAAPVVTVDTLADENDGVAVGGISLRDALAEVDSGGQVLFHPALSGQVISLQHGELALLDKSVHIDASTLPCGITIEGNQASRILRLGSGLLLNHTVSLTNLTLRNGRSHTGGALYGTKIAGGTGTTTLNFTECHFARNHATINGGAIHIDGSYNLNLTRSSICWNSTDGQGGGIYSSGTLTATSSTLACNHSTGEGAAAYFVNFPAQLNHCTLTENRSTHANPSTIHARFYSSVTLFHTICSGGPTPNINKEGTATITSDGYNIFGDSAPSYAVATDILTNNPKLEPPMRRGGCTFTCAFRPDSPACNTGDPNPIVFLFPTTDQRGFPRFRDGLGGFFFDNRIDIGAYELGETLTVTTALDENFTAPDTGLSLREAIANAASNGPGTRITIDPALPSLNPLLLGELVIDSDLWLDGTSRRNNWEITRDPIASDFRNLRVAFGRVATVEAMSLHYGVATGSLPGDGLGGGCILVNSGAHLNLVDAYLGNSRAEQGNSPDGGVGGGLQIDGASAFLLRSTVNSCEAVIRGGGISVRGRLHAANSTIWANTCLGIGGGIADHANDEILLESCTISGNTNNQPGGAGLAVGSSVPRIAYSIFADNTPQNFSSTFSTTPISLGANLEDGSGMFSGPDDITNTNPQLSVDTQYNRIGRTPVLVPDWENSPAIDRGPTADNYALCHRIDQIGGRRVKPGVPDPIDAAARLDLGAVEAQQRILVTTFLDENDGPDAGEGTSLREAVAIANEYPDPDLILLAHSNCAPFQLESAKGGELHLTTEMMIRGMEGPASFSEIRGPLVNEPAERFRLFRLSGLIVVELDKLTLSKGHLDTENGGGVLCEDGAALRMTNCHVKDCHANHGGGVAANSVFRSSIISSSTFSGNTANGHGGALYLTNSLVNALPFTISSSTFWRNQAGGSGGAIRMNDFLPSVLLRVTLAENSATSGGGISTAAAAPGAGWPDLNNSILAHNSPDDLAGSAFPSGVLYTTPHPDLVADPASIMTDPLLKPFGDYGGPTPTLALSNTSPAIDYSSFNSNPDQRGAQPQDGNNDSTVTDDAGAFEFVPPIVVTTNIDEQDGPFVGGLSLREAIEAASNTLHALIQFHPSLDGSTITLLTPAPLAPYTEALNVPLGSSITIDASTLPNGITITDDLNEVPPHSGIPNAHDLLRFNIATGPFDDSYLGLENLTFTNSSLSALALNGNHHRIHNCLFKDNSEPGGFPALSTTGQLELSNSTFLNNGSTRGAALHNGGFGTVTQCTFSGNTAAEGAVIYNEGCLDFLHCTFANNTVIDLPFHNLTAAGAIAYQNSFGPSSSTNLTFRNCLFDDPVTIPLFANEPNFPGTVTSLGRNLTRSAVPEFNHPDDLISSDTLLKPFADFPLPGSFPLIHSTDAVDVVVPTLSDPTIDQRGYRRPLDGNGDGFAFSDIGAVEAPPVILVTTDVDENDGIGNGAGTSLRDAVAVMNARNYAEMPVIGFASHLDGATIQLEAGPGGEILFSAAQEIDASTLPGGIAIAGSRTAGGGNYRVFQANAPGESIQLTGLTIEQGWANDWGGGLLVENATACVLTDCTVRDNFAVQLGGGIAARNGSLLTLERCTLSANQCDSLGGGIGVDSSFVFTLNSTISGNHAESGGGGIADVSLSDIDLGHTTIANNTATTGGGGIDMIATAARTSHVLLVQNFPFNFFERAPAGDITSLGYNLDDGTNGEFTQLTDRENVSDPMIEPLADNGGRTQTHALIFNSPAIDAGDPALTAGGLLVTDQTGQTSRIADGDYLAPDTIDIGAFEFDVSTLPPDMDGDCIPNGAEVAMGFDPQNPADGLADQDGDLIPAGKEWLAGTDDNDPLSKFEMLSVIDLTGLQDEFEVVWSSVNNPNVTYDLELTEDGHNWIPYEFGIPATGPTTIRIVPWLSSTNSLFFRVKADRSFP